MWLMLSGVVLGVVIGVTGMGAGSLALPWLLWLGLPLEVAVGTALLSSSLVKVYGMLGYARRGLVDWGVVLRMWVGSLSAVLLLGIFAVGVLKLGWLLSLAGGLIMVTGLLVLLRGKVGEGLSDRDNLLSMGGLAIGSSMVLTSIGAGVLSTMWLLWTKPSLRGSKLVGTELAHAVPVAGLASLFYASRGSVSYDVLVWLLLGMLLGMWLSLRYLPIWRPGWIQRVVAMLLIAIGIKMLLT